jgi:hypothetical protein
MFGSGNCVNEKSWLESIGKIYWEEANVREEGSLFEESEIRSVERDRIWGRKRET